MALRPALQVPDPFARASILRFGQLLVVVNERLRLIGVAIQSKDRDEVLVAVCGRDEYGDYLRKKRGPRRPDRRVKHGGYRGAMRHTCDPSLTRSA